MNKSALQLFLWSIVLMLAQALVFNHVCLFGYAVPFVFVYVLAKLPLTLSREWLFTLGFAVGLTVDIFSDTLGMNALAATITVALRHPIIRLYVQRDEELPDTYPGIQSFGMYTFVKYVLTLSLLYCTLIFFIDSFSTFDLWRIVLRIIASTVLTSLILVGIDSLTVSKREKRL